MPQEEQRRHYDEHITRLEEQLHAHIAADILARGQIQESIDALTTSISGLLQAWNTANGIGTFLKWLSGTAVAVAFGWQLLKDYFTK